MRNQNVVFIFMVRLFLSVVKIKSWHLGLVVSLVRKREGIDGLPSLPHDCRDYNWVVGLLAE